MTTLFDKINSIASQRKTRVIQIEEWDNIELVVHEVSPKERAVWERMQVNVQKGGSVTISDAEGVWNFRAHIIRMAVTESDQEGNDTGAKFITDESQLKTIGENWGTAGVERLVNAILGINHWFEKVSDEDREKN